MIESLWVHCGWVIEGALEHLCTSFLGDNGRCLVWSDTVEVCIHHTVRLTLTTLACKSAVEEASIQKHVPEQWVTPIVRSVLRENLDSDIVVSTLQVGWCSPTLLQVEANKVCSQLFECLIESGLIVHRFALTKTDQSITISDKDQHSSVVDSIEWSNIGNRIRVDENECKLRWIENLVASRLEVALWASVFIALTLINSLLTHIKVFLMNVILVMSFFLSLLFHKLVVIFKIASSSELFQHFQFVLSVFFGPFKKTIFLFSLSQINNIGPTLFIFGLEVFQKVVEWFITSCHFLDWLIKWFSFCCFLGSNKFLQSLYFRNSFWFININFLVFLFTISKKEHLTVLILVLSWIICQSRRDFRNKSSSLNCW